MTNEMFATLNVLIANKRVIFRLDVPNLNVETDVYIANVQHIKVKSAPENRPSKREQTSIKSQTLRQTEMLSNKFK